jgi:hypothetical protein
MLRQDVEQGLLTWCEDRFGGNTLPPELPKQLRTHGIKLLDA